MVWTVEYYSALHRARILVSKNTFTGQKQAEKVSIEMYYYKNIGQDLGIVLKFTS